MLVILKRPAPLYPPPTRHKPRYPVLMNESLKAASESLRTSLDRYLRVCSSIRSCSSNGKLSREFAHQLDAEFTHFSSYETTIQQAKLDIAHTRNYSSPLMPINSLPSEIIIRIFSLAASPCNFNLLYQEDEEGLPKYPELLLGVCSRWNKVISSTPSLWAHLDLIPDESYVEATVIRAQSHSKRAGGLPLHIHIVDSDGISHDNVDVFYNFLASIASRMKTFEFDVNDSFEIDHALIFQELLADYRGHFTELIIRSHWLHADAFILPGTHGRPIISSDRLLLDLPQESMEENFIELELLHLRGIFPHWTSSAYCGLVDLRLTSSSDCWSSITQQQLVRFLKNCPELQILHLALIIEGTGSIMDVKQVQLRSLEVISLSATPADKSGSSTSQLASILRLLAPGSHPLRLTLENEFYDEPLLSAFKEFVARSPVVKLCVKGACPPLHQLLHLAPGLEALVFDSCTQGLDPRTYISMLDLPIALLPGLDSFPHLRSWYILNCEVGLTELNSMVELDENKTIALSKCTFIAQDGQVKPLSDIELSAAFPSVRFIPGSVRLPNPTADWDFLG